MKAILVINSGSSSIKFQLINANDRTNLEVICKGLIERIGIQGSNITLEKAEGIKILDQAKFEVKDHEVGASLLLQQLVENKIILNFKDIVGVGHRVVHGGADLIESCIIDEEVIAKIKQAINLSPLHNPAALLGISAFKAKISDVVHVAVFDTSFHQTLKPEQFLYPVPYDWYEKYQVRRYGFHGISYRYVLSRLTILLKKEVQNINAIVCHLGNGASICAIRAGASFATTMGLTPLDGLMMGSRSGIIDPSISGYMMRVEPQLTIEDVNNSFNKQSGLLGISGVSSDLRDVIAATPTNSRAQLALEMFVDRIVNFIVQYANNLENKIDALVFTGGIGENSAIIRTKIFEKLKIGDFKFDEKANEASYQQELVIGKINKTNPIYKLRTNEEVVICKDVLYFVK